MEEIEPATPADAQPDDREWPLAGPRVTGLANYASIGFDLGRIAEGLKLLRLLPTISVQTTELYTRAALWDSVVSSYGRMFVGGYERAVHAVLLVGFVVGTFLTRSLSFDGLGRRWGAA